MIVDLVILRGLKGQAPFVTAVLVVTKQVSKWCLCLFYEDRKCRFFICFAWLFVALEDKTGALASA